MKTIILLIIISLLMACNHLKQGKIVNKHYEPTRTYTMLMPTVIGKTTILIPYIMHDDEDWVLTVEGVYDGEMRTENVYVSPQCYRQNIVEYWTKDQDCSYTDDNNTKIKQ
jgi:hypothetical protein